MAERWRVLAVLFTVRVAMAFQFQSVASLSSFMMADYGFGLADIGLLIGLYVSPGILIALPGGAIGRRFGDKQAVAFGMALMIAGGLLIALSPTWEAQVAGRVLAGLGGVILNVLMSKMVSDWFAGGSLATAMGIFVNSWPVGIALALLTLPPLAGVVGLGGALWVTVALAALGLSLLLLGYRPASALDGQTAEPPVPLRGRVLVAVVIAGAIWGLYNAALGMIFSFGAPTLTGQGWTVEAASATTSLVLWIVALSVPLGGLLADRLGRREAVLASGLISFAVLMLLTPEAEAVRFMFIALGVVGGVSAGPIMSLPASVLKPGNRAVGMGVYFTLFYVAIFLGPVVAGHLSDAAGRADVAFTLGGAMLLACLALLAMFRALRASIDRTTGS